MNDEQLAHVMGTVEELHAGHRELLDVLRAVQQPADIKTHRLTSTTPTKYDKQSTEADTRSIGVYNPTGITVYLGLNGGTANAAAEGMPVPPKGLLVLPVAVAQLEIAADPADLAAGDAIVFVLRYRTVQPAFLGSVR